MKDKTSGEGCKSFPYFFPLLVILAFFIGPTLLLSESAAQKGKEELSRFDRMAQEATLLNNRGQSDQVISLLEPHKSDAKNDSALFFNELGVAYRKKGKLGEAVQAYQKALTLDPGNPVIMKNLADVFYLQKEYPKAIEFCKQALQSNPRFHQAHSTLGLAYYRLGKYKESLAEFETVLKLNPEDEQAKNFRQDILKKLEAQKK